MCDIVGTRAFRPPSLRAYLLFDMNIRKKLKARIILAESANQLYRESQYTDLISFEEDIAYLASSVLVIAESAGSLAELGAFSAIENMRPSVSIIMQQKYETAESFVRFGPVERVQREDPQRVAFFPWRTDSANRVIKRTAKVHCREIVSFINSQIGKSRISIPLTFNSPLRTALLVYWILYTSTACTSEKIREYIKSFGITIDKSTLHKILYCMKVAGWIMSETYSNIKYYYCLFDQDPLDYAFNATTVVRDSIRVKHGIIQAMKRDLRLPRHVQNSAIRARDGA